jgi:hypothetical protein
MIGIGRAYVVEFHNVAITAQQDLFYIKPAADKICVIEKVLLHVVGGTADAGDAQEELLDVEMCYIPATVTASSGGNSFTPQPLAINDAAAGFTARINDTTKATSSGTIVNRGSAGWNSRSEHLWLPAPEHRVLVANAAAVTYRLNTTPADSITANGEMIVRELP